MTLSAFTAKIRVLLVDDSPFFLKVLEQGLSRDPRIDIVGTANDPFEAMDKINTLNPDVVTLDVEMPKMNGIDFLKKLIPIQPLPVIVVSSLPIRVLDALDAGAVDFVRKPDSDTAHDVKSFLTELLIKVKIASVAKVKSPQPPSRPAPARDGAPLKLTASPSRLSQTVIAIGASTGGTEAILSVIKDLPKNTPGILVVQHMPPVFTGMYAQRLDRLAHMKVEEAANLQRLEPGKVIVGAGDFHLRLGRDAEGYYITSRPGEKVSGHCPSVDVLFESVAAAAGENAIGVILTGMGSDGAKGLLSMRKKGAYTLGQDQETSVVYGMPHAAYKNGSVQTQLPLDRIPGDIVRFLNTVT